MFRRDLAKSMTRATLGDRHWICLILSLHQGLDNEVGMNSAPFRCAFCLMLVTMCSPIAGGGEPSLFSLNGNDLRLPPGEYYPGPYYSRGYLQAFPLTPNQQPIYFRLIPFEHYGEYRLGTPVPGLTSGDIQSNWFPYRYHYGFQPHVHRVPPFNECDYIRRIDPGPTISP